MKINYIFEVNFFNRDFGKNEFKRIVKSVIEKIIKIEKIKLIEINFLFCNSRKILDYNKKYLSHNFVTDIITFYDVNEKNEIQSDVIISVEAVKENSLRFKEKFSSEMLRVIIHGLLHLCGYIDKSSVDKKKMKERENFYLNTFVT